MNLEEMSQQELVDLVKKIMSRKKYGLVWEDEKTREIFNSESQGAFPSLAEIEANSFNDKSSNSSDVLIEGDNYFALLILRYTHFEKIDTIYIDPPYNTGNNDFKYNDSFVLKDDVYRHSSWLAFMSKRLWLAKDLLKQSGIIVISIDDNEQANLKLLCDEVFGENNFIACIPTVMNLKGNQDQFGFAGTHEYTLIYTKNKNSAEFRNLTIDEDKIEGDWEQDEVGWWKKGAGLKMTGINAPREKQPSLFFPVWVRPEGNEISLEEIDGWDKILPITDGREMSWRWSRNKFIRDKSDVIISGATPNWTFYKKQRPEIGELPSKKPKSIFYRPEYSTTNGTNQVKAIFGEKIFDYPKPLDLIMDLFEITTTKNSLVLDFFAGSGTTGHAIRALNSKDGGKRNYILVTNNDGNICTEVCYPRLKKISSGFTDSSNRKVKGLGGSLRYFQVKFIQRSSNADEMKIRMTENCFDILRLKESIFSTVKLVEDKYVIFMEGDESLVVYFSFDHSHLNEVKKAIEELGAKKTKIYIFDFDSDNFSFAEFDNWDNVDIEILPQKLISNFGEVIV